MYSIEESLQLSILLRNSKFTGAKCDILKFLGCKAPLAPMLTQAQQTVGDCQDFTMRHLGFCCKPY